MGTFSGDSSAQIAAETSSQAGIRARWNHDGLSPLTFFKDGRVSLATDVAYLLVEIPQLLLGRRRAEPKFVQFRD